MPQAAIFTILLVLAVLGAVGVIFAAIADVVLTIWSFFINLHYAWFIAFTVVASAIALVRHHLTDGEKSFNWTMVQLCVLTMTIIFIIIPLAHRRQWNNDFKCRADSQCYGDGKCIGGFCTVPFGGDQMGKAEFTQGQYKEYLHGRFLKDCEKFRGSKMRDWERHYKCENSVDAKVGDRFKDVLLPAHCNYFWADAKPEKALLLDDDAPMPCLTRDEAAQICADLGGRLPNLQEYLSIFEDQKLSCENTVMVGLDKFTGYITKLKHREIKRMKFGPGCGSGTFRQACDKHRHGNTKEGFCDVYGNVAEWTGDGGAVGGSFRSFEITKEDEIEAAGASGARIDVGFRCLIIGEHL